jgi:prepilin-type N-terminal cleavage/methylation domain-containing protein
MKKEHSAGAVIFFQKGKKREYLLLNYLGGHWGFPKGHIELHENPFKTAIREIKEETGLDVRIIRGFERKITYSFYHKGEYVIKDVVFYLAKAKSQQVRLSQEHKGYVWFDFKSAYKLITYEKGILKSAENFLNSLKPRAKAGFTLIELLVVLSMILVLFALASQAFKPAAYLRKTRDIKRIADLKAIDMALKVYLTATTTPSLGPANKGVDQASSTIFISVPFDKEDIRNQTLPWNSKTYYFSQVSSTEGYKNNGNGWLPVNLSLLPSQPLFAYPVDPINSYGKKLFYSYVFNQANLDFEVNAKLEFEGYKLNGPEDKVSTDGGNNQDIYEVGNNLNLMPNNLY